MATDDLEWTHRRRRISTVLACSWLGYLGPVVFDLVQHPPGPVRTVLAWVGLVAFVGCYVRLIVVGMRRPFQIAAPAVLVGLLAICGLLLWPIGVGWLYTFPYYLAASLPTQLPQRYWVPAGVSVTLGTLALELAYGDHGAELVGRVGSVAAVGLLMSMFSWILMAVVRLRRAQSELARLAVADERLRIARDLHDVLGHRLAAVALKSDLARRLVAVDPGRAEAEMASAGQIVREALDEVRATVSGIREASLRGELSTAQALLAAAGVECVVAVPAETLPVAVADVAGWVVREGVTNVVRHARADRAWITVRGVDPVVVDVTDDGQGSAEHRVGNGLTGLSERVTAVGGTLTAGREGDRFRLRAVLPVPDAERAAAVTPVPVAGGA
ncbi:MAG: histidine kinase [Actinocatenispora sp.]